MGTGMLLMRHHRVDSVDGMFMAIHVHVLGDQFHWSLRCLPAAETAQKSEHNR
jgi:hypothetical protein